MAQAVVYRCFTESDIVLSSYILFTVPLLLLFYLLHYGENKDYRYNMTVCFRMRVLP